MKNPRAPVMACMAIAALLLSTGVLPADEPGIGWLDKPRLLQKLDAQGFKNAKDIKAVHGHWEGEAFEHGAIVIFRANAQTGQVTFRKAKDNPRAGH